MIYFIDITKSNDLKFLQKLTQRQEKYQSIKNLKVISFRDITKSNDFKKI